MSLGQLILPTNKVKGDHMSINNKANVKKTYFQLASNMASLIIEYNKLMLQVIVKLKLKRALTKRSSRFVDRKLTFCKVFLNLALICTLFGHPRMLFDLCHFQS